MLLRLTLLVGSKKTEFKPNSQNYKGKKAGKVKANHSVYCSSHYLELLGEVIPKLWGDDSVPDISNIPV